MVLISSFPSFPSTFTFTHPVQLVCKHKSLLSWQPLLTRILIWSGKQSECPCKPALVVLGYLLSMAWSFTKLCQMRWKTTPVFAVPKCPSIVAFSILYLENGDDGPEQGVKVLPVRQSVTIPLRSKLTAKEVHPQDAANDRKQGLNNGTTTQISNHTAGRPSPDFTWVIPFYVFFKKMDPLFAEKHALRSRKPVVNLGQICQGVSTKKYVCSLFFFCFTFCKSKHCLSTFSKQNVLTFCFAMTHFQQNMLQLN